MRVVTIVGARPQFIKAAPVVRALREAGHEELLVHTGQHYDRMMSRVFFEELGIPEPYTNLEVGPGRQGWQTARMLERIEELLCAERPDRVLVYGDTTSTLAGALAACKLRIPLAHVEAGLRSYNREMPEEHNRVLTDHCADLLFCPTHTAVENLACEGVTAGVNLVGDTMYDAVLEFSRLAAERPRVLEELGLRPGEYLLATVHRAYNTDSPDVLRGILAALAEAGDPVVFPVHPRTRARMAEWGIAEPAAGSGPGLRMIEPVSYLDMLVLEKNARLVLTDSGGMQKEAFFLRVPCITLRPETEWVETVEAGWNVVVGTEPARIAEAIRKPDWPRSSPPQVFGDGDAAARIVAALAVGPP